MIYLFVFTLGIVILNIIKIATLFAKHELSLPGYKLFGPDSTVFFYPSFFYQVWWINYFGLLNN